MKIPTITLAVVILAASGAAPGVAPVAAQDAVRQPTLLTVTGLRGPTGIALAPGLAEGTVRGEFARVEYDLVPDPPTMVARLVSGETDIGVLPSNLAAQLYNRGVPIRIAAVTLWGLLYVVGPAELGEGWESVAGREVQAIGQGATPDILFRHLAEQRGSGAAPILTFRYAPVELTQLVAAGRHDLALLPEPFVTQVLSQRDDLAVLIDLQREWRALYDSSYPQTVIVVRRDVERDSPDAIAEALTQIEQGMDRIGASPERAADLVGRTVLGIPPAVVRSALPRLNAEYVSSDAARDALDAYFGVLFAVEPRSIGGAVPDDGAYR